MKTTIITLVAAALLAVVAVPAAAQKKGAQMTFKTNTYDFGDIPRKGGDVECVFEFVNDGDAPLVITRVITSCSCTKAVYSKKPIAAGQTSTMKIIYEPHKKEPGVFHKVIQIFTNAPESRKIVTVNGNSIDRKK